MTPDTDKLIRQLSLVAYLMAEKRSSSARDVKQSVEGYYEMSDEAFARRFYADRTELLGLGVPIVSERDEFTGEELYNLSREQYFLPPLHLTDDELAALQTAVYLLEGQFAYAEPLRLALQNLALGRPNPTEDVTPAVTLSLLGRGYGPEVAARLQKLESAVSKQRTVLFRYYAISRDEESERRVDPYALYLTGGQWYLVGHDRDRDAIRTFRLMRIQGDVRFATRRERDFRVPADFRATAWRDRAPYALGEDREPATVWVSADAAWLVERAAAGHGRIERLDDRSALFHTEYDSWRAFGRWLLSLPGQAAPVAPAELVEEVAAGLQRVIDAHEGPPPTHAAPRLEDEEPAPAPPRGESPVAPERFAVLQALLAELLAACGDSPRGSIEAARLRERFHLDAEGLEQHLHLLNLVNFGGGCYAVYAELVDDGATILVEKELYGEEFRRPARLSPLEGKALLLALDLVGPLVAAGAHTSLDTVRQKVEAAFARREAQDVPVPPPAAVPEDVLSVLADSLREHRVVEIEYLSRRDDAPTTREVEPHFLRGVQGDWYCDTWDRTSGGERTFRVDRVRAARPTGDRFEPRPQIAQRTGAPELSGPTETYSVLFSPEVARWVVEEYPSTYRLEDGGAVSSVRYSNPRVLATEICRWFGDAVLIAPAQRRADVVERARELLEAVRQRSGVSAG